MSDWECDCELGEEEGETVCINQPCECDDTECIYHD